MQSARKFVLTIDQTRDLSVAELTKALSRVAGQIDSGRMRLEGGLIRGSAGKAIGSYHWEDQDPAARYAPE
jgi:hypothetical protein